MKTKLIQVSTKLVFSTMLAMTLGACATSKAHQREVLQSIQNEIVKSHDASCDEIRAYLARLEIGVTDALNELK